MASSSKRLRVVRARPTVDLERAEVYAAVQRWLDAR